MSSQSEVITFTYPNAIVRVHLPDLTDEEHNRRMKKIYKAAGELVKEKIGGKREKKETL